MKTPSLRIECAYCTQTLHFSSFCQSWRHCQCWSTLHPSLRHGTHGPSRNYCRHSCWTCFIVQGWETPWMHRWFHWHILFLSPIEMPLACVSDWPGKDCPAPPGSLGFLQCLCLSWMAHYWSQAKFRFGDFSWAVNGKSECCLSIHVNYGRTFTFVIFVVSLMSSLMSATIFRAKIRKIFLVCFDQGCVT